MVGALKEKPPVYIRNSEGLKDDLRELLSYD
jgi:hypothetical protein